VLAGAADEVINSLADVAFWHIASLYGDAATLSLSE
jgi:hypothetical protein